MVHLWCIKKVRLQEKRPKRELKNNGTGECSSRRHVNCIVCLGPRGPYIPLPYLSSHWTTIVSVYICLTYSTVSTFLNLATIYWLSTIIYYMTNPVRWLQLYSLDRWRNWGSERLSFDWCTWLMSCEARTQSKVSLTPKHKLLITILYSLSSRTETILLNFCVPSTSHRAWHTM